MFFVNFTSQHVVLLDHSLIIILKPETEPDGYQNTFLSHSIECN